METREIIKKIKVNLYNLKEEFNLESLKKIPNKIPFYKKIPAFIITKGELYLAVKIKNKTILNPASKEGGNVERDLLNYVILCDDMKKNLPDFQKFKEDPINVIIFNGASLEAERILKNKQSLLEITTYEDFEL